MPIYEYNCKSCKKNFEELVFKAEEIPPCPYCASTETARILSPCKHTSGGADYAPRTSSSTSSCSGCSGGNCSSCG